MDLNDMDRDDQEPIEAGRPDVNGPKAPETFEDVFAREQHNMVRLAYLLLNSQEQAEEAAQDAFARLLDRFDAVTNPGGFVRTATINRSRDLLRRRKRERLILDRFKTRPTPKHSSASDLTPGGLSPGAELEDVLAVLKQRPREVVVLRFYLDHTHAEIAELLNMKETTVRTTLHRALLVLREQLS